MQNSKYPKAILIIEVLALLVSGYFALEHDFWTWVLEVSPAVVGIIVFTLTYKKLRFSNFIYLLLLIHSFVLMYGGIYTYAETPLGEWMKGWFGFERNNYDKIGHFMQGFVPVLLIREFLLKKEILKLKGWVSFISISITLALAAFYEFIEWWISLLTGSKGDAFLGTQGYVWDTQSDMLFCLIGSMIAVLLLSKIHDRYFKI